MSDSKPVSQSMRITEELEKTPVVPPWTDMQRDITELKSYCHRICEGSIDFQKRLPALEKQVNRLTLFQAWFPTVAALMALLYLAVR